MIKLKWRGETNPKKWSGLITLERNVDTTTSKFVLEAGEWLINDIRKSWSSTQPSAPMQRPAMDSGNLDTAIQAAVQNGEFRKNGGQFASLRDFKTFTFRFAAAEGGRYHGRGEYIRALEEGRVGAEARPFIEPSLNNLRRAFPLLAKQKIKG